MATFADKLMLWGSPRVIEAWVAMRRNAADGPPPVTSQMEDFGRMVLAIRREFGHSDRRLEERDLFRIIFTRSRCSWRERISVMVLKHLEQLTGDEQ